MLVVPCARVRRSARPPVAGPDRAAGPAAARGARTAARGARAAAPLALLLTALALLLVRRPAAAAAELRALRALARLGQLRAGRRRRRATATAAAAQRRAVRRSARRWLRTRLGETAERVAAAAGHRSVRLRPGAATLVVAGLAVVALVAERSLLGAGRLVGGGLGASSGAGPGVVAVELLLLASVPLAGLTAWCAAGRLWPQRASAPPHPRGWLTLAWALLPAVTGAVGDGRLDRAVLAAALPLLLVLGWAVLADDPRDDGWRRVWALALALLLVGAVAPQVLLPAAGLLLLPAGVAAAAGAPGARRRLSACATALAVPAVGLLLDGAAVRGAGLTGPSVPRLLLAPGPAGLPLAVLCGGLLLGGLAALLHAGRPRLALGGWGLALAGLVPGVAADVGVLLVAAGLLLAVVSGAAGLPAALARASFGRRQVGALVVGVATAAVPVLCGGAWLLGGTDGPLARRTPVALPAYVRAGLAADGTRSLLLRPHPDGAVHYAVGGPDGPLATAPADPALDRAVAGLAADGESGGAALLGRRGIAEVALPGERTADARRLAAALDGEPGLSRETDGSLLLWQVTAPVQGITAAPRPTGRAVAQALALAALVALAGAPHRPAVR